MNAHLSKSIQMEQVIVVIVGYVSNCVFPRQSDETDGIPSEQ